MAVKIIGISAYYHDSAAALLIDGKITAAAQEERCSGRKHDPDFLVNALKYGVTNSYPRFSQANECSWWDIFPKLFEPDQNDPRSKRHNRRQTDCFQW